VPDVDDEDRVREVLHVLDAAEAALELVHLPAQADHLLLAEALEGAVLGHGLQLAQALDGLPDGAEVGQHPAQPAVVDVGHPAAARLLADDLARGALGAHEQHDAPVRRQAAGIAHGLLEQRQRLLQVDDVDTAPLAVDVGGHLRVPVAGLVAEVRAGLQELAHGDLGHVGSSRSGWA